MDTISSKTILAKYWARKASKLAGQNVEREPEAQADFLPAAAWTVLRILSAQDGPAQQWGEWVQECQLGKGLLCAKHLSE